MKSTFIGIFFFVFRLVACAPFTGSGDAHHSKSIETLIFNNVENLSVHNCGKVTTGGPFPWDVELQYDAVHSCSGVLISSRDVIASASCVNKIEDIAKISVSLRNNSLAPKIVRPAHVSKDDWVILNLDQTIPDATPICLWNFGASFQSDDNFLLYNAELENSHMHAATVEDSSVCMQFAEHKYLRDLRGANFFCIQPDDGNNKHQHNNNDRYLINKYDGRWFLRGFKLQELSLSEKLLFTYSDLSLHLRWIADNSRKIYALPKIPSSKKPYDFKSGPENLSAPSCGLSSDFSVDELQDNVENIGYEIFGGWNAAKGAHPWFARIEVDKDDPSLEPGVCGGTLIRDNVVLTAAHCVWQNNKAVSGDKMNVFMGLNGDEFDQNMKPRQVIVHEQYGNYRHDIALLIFEKSFKLTSNVSPICLWNKHNDFNSIVNTQGTVVGFGVRNLKPPIEMSDTLQRADLPIVPYEKCFQTGNDATFWNRLIPGENFCAGYKNGTSTCQGDSGGGIAFKVNGRWFLRGIVSFGPVRKGTEFCDPNNYSIFLDVAHYLEWIEKSIEKTKVYYSSSMGYLISLVLNFVMTYYVFVLIVSVLVLSNVCMLILYCRKRTERARSAGVQFYTNPEAISSQAMLLNK